MSSFAALADERAIVATHNNTSKIRKVFLILKFSPRLQEGHARKQNV
jgi:hypothetical protein